MTRLENILAHAYKLSNRFEKTYDKGVVASASCWGGKVSV